MPMPFTSRLLMMLDYCFRQMVFFFFFSPASAIDFDVTLMMLPFISLIRAMPQWLMLPLLPLTRCLLTLPLFAVAAIADVTPPLPAGYVSYAMPPEDAIVTSLRCFFIILLFAMPIIATPCH